MTALCLQVLAQLVKTSHVSEMEALRMDENITLFEDCLGTCERILKTPIPLSYTRQGNWTLGRLAGMAWDCVPGSNCLVRVARLAAW